MRKIAVIVEETEKLNAIFAVEKDQFLWKFLMIVQDRVKRGGEIYDERKYKENK